MLYAELLKLWDESVQAMDSRDWQGALEKLQQVQEPTSRILFNAATAHLALGHLDMALKCLDLTISKDEHLAVGFFQRAAVNMQLERLEDALSDCIWAQKHMRKNTVIDYKQLGLRFKLYSWQVCHPLTHSCLLIPNITEAGARSLRPGEVSEPLGSSVVGRLSAVDSALESDRAVLPTPLTVPESLVFRPRKQEVEQLQKKDFLGKAKVKSLLLSLYSCRIMNTLSLTNASSIPHPSFSLDKVKAGVTGGCFTFSSTCSSQHSGPPEEGSVVVKVHYTYTVAVTVPLNTPYHELKQRIAQKLGHPASELCLRFACEDHQHVQRHASNDPLVNRHILYQMVALYNYDAQGPEDLEFSEGDTIDILSEVNEEWLEGHCAGNVGIFPSCFAYRENSSLYPSQI
uniref:NADPH oxidase activator 1 n=1 Tax=Oryzias latipes TaxID=8090 RepID=A0A3P9KRY0_ORYLA